jgi:acetoin utilization deacetylase AcuC-like enzyme
LNFPLPAGATGDVYRHAVDEVLLPVVSAWEPTWLIVSAGFDGHRRDPLTDLHLTSADFADLTVALTALVPAGRRLLFLEGGYDLEALSTSTGAVLSALVDDGRYRPEEATSGGPGAGVSAAVLKNWVASADG